MKSWYQRFVYSRERDLTLRDSNRRILRFDWGLEWVANGAPIAHPLAFFRKQTEEALKDSDSFFAAPPLRDYALKGNLLTFPTPCPTPYPSNNTVCCRIFPGHSESAVIVVPQWNADEHSPVGLCRILQSFGITALRLSLPYHERRAIEGLRRADYMVSPNVGRTLHATRQSVLEVRQLVDWLRQQGYKRIGVVGTSIGSCVTYLAFVHDRGIATGVFNHVASFFADVVWTGLSTRYVRWGLETNISLEDLRTCWAPISPWHFVARLQSCPRPHLLISAKYDLTFLPALSEKVFEQYRACAIPHDHAQLPCGHYTTARFPYKYIDGWHICRYLIRQLRKRL